MRRWGVLLLLAVSVAVASMVTAVPAHAASVDPDAAARQFFDLLNGERAGTGLPTLGWRDDVASMAVDHSSEMAQAGSIWHGSFVSEGNLTALDASLLAENVGMGGDVESIHAAFMNSEHHRDNILDPGLNEVGVGVVVAGDGTVFVTEDFLHDKGVAVPRVAAAPKPAPAPRPAAPPKPASAPKPIAPKVAAAPRVHASATPTAPPTTAAPAPASAPAAPVPAPAGLVNAVPLVPSPASAAVIPAGVLSGALDGGTAVWVAMFGTFVLMAAVGWHVSVRRRRSA